MLEQERAFANVVARAGWGWNMAQFGAEDVLDMPEIGLRLAIADLYAGLAFGPGPAAG